MLWYATTASKRGFARINYTHFDYNESNCEMILDHIDDFESSITVTAFYGGERGEVEITTEKATLEEWKENGFTATEIEMTCDAENCAMLKCCGDLQQEFDQKSVKGCYTVEEVLDQRPDLLCDYTNGKEWIGFGCEFACRYANEQCNYILDPPTHKLRMWSRHDQPPGSIDTVSYVETSLAPFYYDNGKPFDVSDEMHKYSLEFTWSLDGDMQKVWDVELSTSCDRQHADACDARPRAILENVPGFEGKNEDVIFATHLFSFSSFEEVKAADDQNKGWGGTATIESTDLVHPDRITCRDRHEVFFNKQRASELTFEIAIGTEPYLDDVVPLTKVKRNGAITVQDAHGNDIEIASTHVNFKWGDAGSNFMRYTPTDEKRTCASTCIDPVIAKNHECKKVDTDKDLAQSGSHFGILEIKATGLDLKTTKQVDVKKYLEDGLLEGAMYNSNPRLAACRQSITLEELEALRLLDAITDGAASNAADLKGEQYQGTVEEAATYYITIMAENNAGAEFGRCVSKAAGGVTIDVTAPKFETPESEDNCKPEVDMAGATSDDTIVVTQNFSKSATTAYDLVDNTIYDDEENDVYDVRVY